MFPAYDPTRKSSRSTQAQTKHDEAPKTRRFDDERTREVQYVHWGHAFFSRRVDVMSTPRGQAVLAHLRGHGVSAARAEAAIRRHPSTMASSARPEHVALDLITWEGLD